MCRSGRDRFASRAAGPGHRDCSLAGPKRPQDRIELGKVCSSFSSLFSKPIADNGFNRPAALLHTRHHVHGEEAHRWLRHPRKASPLGRPRALWQRWSRSRPTLAAAGRRCQRSRRRGAGDVAVGDGDVLIAAIARCTNAGNPSVMLAAGLLGQEGGEAASRSSPTSRHRWRPARASSLNTSRKPACCLYLEKLGFCAGLGCTTCIGNAGDLTPELDDAITSNDLVCAACCRATATSRRASTPNLKANFLASPPLVVAYAITRHGVERPDDRACRPG